MRKVIAAINMTLDGFCDHTAIDPDDEIHDHYGHLIREAGTLLYGRITYELMGYWHHLVTHPSGDPSMDDFAAVMDKIPKLVFSRTLKQVDWVTATLAKKGLEEEVIALRQQAGKDILVGSPSLIIALTQLGLIDEWQLCVHPVLLGSGLPLFKNISERLQFQLLKTKTFGSGAIVLYYGPEIQKETIE